MDNSFEAIRVRLINNIMNESSKIDGTFTMDNINALSAELARIIDMEVNTIIDDVMLDTATGKYLDLKAKEFGVSRNDNESDEHFRNRIFEKIRTPIASGNKNHYKMWAKEISGVLEAKVVPLWNGNGTVKVILLSTSYDSVDESLIDEVKNHIEEHRPIGADVTVVSATPKNINIYMEVQKDPLVDILSIKENLKNQIIEYINSITFKQSVPFSYYKVGDIAFNIDGIVDVIDYTVNGLKQSITTEFDEFFILSEVVIDVN